MIFTVIHKMTIFLFCTQLLEFKNLSVGLFTWNPADFVDDADLVAQGVENVWIAEVGSSSLNGTFDEFKQTLGNSEVILFLLKKIA